MTRRGGVRLLAGAALVAAVSAALLAVANVRRPADAVPVAASRSARAAETVGSVATSASSRCPASARPSTPSARPYIGEES